ncbi:MAG TPA: hypothetical protein VFM98_10345, partial [Ramlibacter sp.]|uniref:hypothetical protein n=1 Tax=Ramlibacter sp. TaxID=1917967 RepID=UPI002D7FB176
LALDLSRMGLVFVHLIACCVTLGLVLKSDYALLKGMLAEGRASERAHLQDMQELQSVVTDALIVLWATGIALVPFDATLKGGGWNYFANPKIQAKIAVVCLLTLNGLALHNFVLPWLRKAGSVLKLSFGKGLLATFAGTVSGVSWLYAAMFGVGRPLSWKFPLEELVAPYPVLIAAGFTCMTALFVWCKYRPARGASLRLPPAFAPAH